MQKIYALRGETLKEFLPVNEKPKEVTHEYRHYLAVRHSVLTVTVFFRLQVCYFLSFLQFHIQFLKLIDEQNLSVILSSVIIAKFCNCFLF